MMKNSHLIGLNGIGNTTAPSVVVNGVEDRLLLAFVTGKKGPTSKMCSILPKLENRGNRND